MNDENSGNVTSAAQTNASVNKPSDTLPEEPAIEDVEKLKEYLATITGQDFSGIDEINEDDESDTAETSTHQPETNNVAETYTFDSLEIDLNSPTEAVKQLFLHFIQNHLTIENLHHIGAGVNSKVKFNDTVTERDYPIFLRLVRTIGENFISGFQTKIDNYVCFAGTRDKKQLELFMVMQWKTAKDDLESSEDFTTENAFHYIVKEVVQALLKQLLKIYKEDSEAAEIAETNLIYDVYTKLDDSIFKELPEFAKKDSKDTGVHLEDITPRLLSESIKAFRYSMEYEEKINYKVTEAVENLKYILDDISSPKPEKAQNHKDSDRFQPQHGADETNNASIISNPENSTKENTMKVGQQQSSIINLPTHVDEKEKATPNKQKPIPNESEQNVADRGKNFQTNTLINGIASNLNTVGHLLRSGKENTPLPLLLHLNCRNHEVTMATLKSATSTEIRQMKMRNGETTTIGAVAYSERQKKFYYGVEAANMKKSDADCHFYNIFELLLMRKEESMPSETVLRYYFENLKTELEDEDNVSFNHVVIVVPDWLEDEDKIFLKKILCPKPFPFFQCKEESMVIAAAFFQERFKREQQPISLAIGCQPPLVIILESFGFIHIKIVVCYKKDDDDGKIDSMIRIVSLVHNEEENRPNCVTKLKSLVENKKFGSDSNRKSPDVTAAKKLFIEACQNFQKICDDENMGRWPKMNCIVISDDNDWNKGILNMLADKKIVNAGYWNPEWNILALQGAAIYCFEGTEKFNCHLTGETNCRPEQQQGSKFKFRSVTLEYDDKRSPDICRNAQELLRACDEFISFTQSHFFRNESRPLIGYLCKRLAKAQACAQISNAINDVLSETINIKTLRENLNGRVVQNCSPKVLKLQQKKTMQKDVNTTNLF